MKIGLIGTGLMGGAMAKKLAAGEHEVLVYNRTRERALPLQNLGIRIASSALEVIQSSDYTILMLADYSAICETLFQSKTIANWSGKTIIQMGTIAPTESLALQRQISATGGTYLEAPVLGSIAEVNAGRLIVMVGGDANQFERCQSLFANFTEKPLLVGPVGTAAALKLALNQLIASLTIAFSLSLSYVQRSGVSVELFMDILRQSALHAPTFDKKLSRMLSRNFSNPNFPTKHLLKDIDLILNAITEAGLETAGLLGVRSVIAKAIQMGEGDSDYSAIYNAINPA
ncbi:MAG: NAD(P)-dependent oxidoreductase [candidate division KSB1 bacterium]|nr:NAD(P)-dependent oxidoreductase [candidate division KSB1 bacterium]